MSQEVTRCTHQPTHSPTREERLSIELQELQAYGEDYSLMTPPPGAIQEADVKNTAEGMKGEKLPPKVGYDLPSHDALAKILPNGRCGVDLLKGAKTELHRAGEQERPVATQANKPNKNNTYQVHHPHRRPPLHDFEDDPNMAEITDLQTKEMENYRSAMSRMAEEIIALRTQVVTLEAENSQLRTDLSLQQDLGRDLLDDTDIDVMTKAEIADRIASLKFKLASATSKAASQRDRIQQLQNDLIKKNDSEKELLKLQRVHQQHDENLHHHQSHLAEMATLKVTVKQQEKAIEKMEKVLENNLREKNKQHVAKKLVVKKQRGETPGHIKEEMESALAAENTRLRGELERIRRQPVSVIQQTAQTKEALPVKERLSLLNKLEMAEARAQTLEAQLKENSQIWGREKQDMLTKLSEQKHGFVRTSTTIQHNVPSRFVSESLHQQSRLKKQKPLK
ncbi:coiled-coil domain-containing protein 33 [Anoplopoma fimbria]|uniref:coiled-coil domain-containing protein 33 n=1 Tax=Anoplopoma fimbria TaxID=229290 RepID=UPI0023EBE346|nr:coiled-coil domain-containing protein 33 [Anoplopoma fimbria]